MGKLFFLTLLVLANSSMGAEKHMHQLIPESVQGWKRPCNDEIYTRETLFHHINGGAELYLLYGFKQVFVRRFVKTADADSEITLEIYDMGSAEDAFGVFSCEREDDDVGIGQGSDYGGGLLRFWKGDYFVSIMARGDENSAKPVMLDLGRAVAGAIRQTGTPHPLVSAVPKPGLLEKEIRFFYDFQILNRQYFIAGENVLHLGRQTPCVFAPYKTDGHRTFLLLVLYPTPEAAENACRNFITEYMPEAHDTGAALMENNTWTVAKTRGRMLMAAFDAPDKKQALVLFDHSSLQERR